MLQNLISKKKRNTNINITLCYIKNFTILLSVGDHDPCHGQKLNLFLNYGKKKTTKLR